jgi:hypothetical protein
MTISELICVTYPHIIADALDSTDHSICSAVRIFASAIHWVGESASYFLATTGGLVLFAVFLAERLRALADGREQRKAILSNLVVVGFTGGLNVVIGLGLVPALGLEGQPGVLGDLFDLVGGFLIALTTALFLNVFPVRDRLQWSGHMLANRIF